MSDVFTDALIPRYILVGHSAEVIGIDQLDSGLNNLHVISASSNGFVFLVVDSSSYAFYNSDFDLQN